MAILKKNIKLLIIIFILLGLSLNFNPVNAAAGSGDGAGDDQKSLYKSGEKCTNSTITREHRANRQGRLLYR